MELHGSNDNDEERHWEDDGHRKEDDNNETPVVDETCNDLMD